jgi:hypothetical protein
MERTAGRLMAKNRVARKPPEIQGGKKYGSTAQFKSNEFQQNVGRNSKSAVKVN